jgi:metal-responsive CopG/Arc/MetJ family transcriptional regulator
MVDAETIKAIEEERDYWQRQAEEAGDLTVAYGHISKGVQQALNAIQRHEYGVCAKTYAEVEQQIKEFKAAREGREYESLGN